MRTKKKQQKKLTHASNASEHAKSVQTDNETGKPLHDLANVLKSVDTKSKQAKENESSMDDGKGGRIWYPWLWNFGKKDNKR